MANIIIRSDEANAAATALTLAVRNHNVCLLSQKLTPGSHTFTYFGEPLTVELREADQLAPGTPRVGIVFAEGEGVQAGIQAVLSPNTPDLLVIIGGGVTAAVEANEAARKFGLNPSNILHVGAFLVGGNATAVRSEKHGVLAGFLGSETSDHVVEMAEATFPQLTPGNTPAVALSSINALFHVPPMLLNAMSVERGDDIRFYVEGFGDSVCRLLLALDADRLKLGSALGLKLLPVHELKARYSGRQGAQNLSLREQINTLSSQSATLPTTFQHRFLRHELVSSFAPMVELAAAVRVDVPTIKSVVRLGEILLDEDLQAAAAGAAQTFLRHITVPSPSHR